MRRSGRHRQHLFSVRRLGVLTARLQPWTNSRAAASFGGMKSRLATDRQCRRRDTQALKHVMCQASKPPAIAFLQVFRLSPAVSSSSAPSRQRDRARRPACARRPLFSQPAPPLPPCAAPTPAQTRKMACAASSTVRSPARDRGEGRSRQPGQPAPPGARCGALPRRSGCFSARGREGSGWGRELGWPRRESTRRCAGGGARRLPARSQRRAHLGGGSGSSGGPARGAEARPRQPGGTCRGAPEWGAGRLLSWGGRAGPRGCLSHSQRVLRAALAGLRVLPPARRGADLPTCFGQLPQSLEKTSTRW